jgi:hypothetical protein
METPSNRHSSDLGSQTGAAAGTKTGVSSSDHVSDAGVDAAEGSVLISRLVTKDARRSSTEQQLAAAGAPKGSVVNAVADSSSRPVTPGWIAGAPGDSGADGGGAPKVAAVASGGGGGGLKSWGQQPAMDFAAAGDLRGSINTVPNAVKPAVCVG